MAAGNLTSKLILLVGLAAGAYVFLFIAGLTLADSLMLPAPSPSYKDEGDLIRIAVPGVGAVPALYLKHPDAQQTLLYSHGNREDLGRIRPRLEQLQAEGFNVLAYEYPGYGIAPGRATERSVIQTADAALAFLLEDEGLDPSQVVLYGRSIGGGPSVSLASRNKLGGLVLEGTFTGVFRVALPIALLPFEKFHNEKLLPSVTCPILVIHGRSDRVVPFRHGERLFSIAGERGTCLWVEGAGHNNLPEHAGKIYWDALKTFLEGVRRSPALPQQPVPSPK